MEPWRPAEMVRRARQHFRRLARAFHPDRCRCPEAKSAFTNLKRALHLLVERGGGESWAQRPDAGCTADMAYLATLQRIATGAYREQDFDEGSSNALCRVTRPGRAPDTLHEAQRQRERLDAFAQRHAASWAAHAGHRGPTFGSNGVGTGMATGASGFGSSSGIHRRGSSQPFVAAGTQPSTFPGPSTPPPLVPTGWKDASGLAVVHVGSDRPQWGNGSLPTATRSCVERPRKRRPQPLEMEEEAWASDLPPRKFRACFSAGDLGHARCAPLSDASSEPSSLEGGVRARMGAEDSAVACLSPVSER